MSKVYHIGCLHLGDERMAKHRGYPTAENYFENLKAKWNSVVTNRDKVFIHGDVGYESDEFYPLLNELNGSKTVIGGNHDLPKHSRELLNYVDGICGMLYYKGMWLTHAPLHPQELARVNINVHAHVHEQPIFESEIALKYWDYEGTVVTKTNQGYVNVDAHLLGLIPMAHEDIVSKFNKLEK